MDCNAGEEAAPGNLPDVDIEEEAGAELSTPRVKGASERQGSKRKATKEQEGGNDYPNIEEAGGEQIDLKKASGKGKGKKKTKKSG